MTGGKEMTWADWSRFLAHWEEQQEEGAWTKIMRNQLMENVKIRMKGWKMVALWGEILEGTQKVQTGQDLYNLLKPHGTTFTLLGAVTIEALTNVFLWVCEA